MSVRRQSIHSIHNKKFWTEFFYLYESLPALWDMNNPLYKNRQVKCDAYDIMVDKLREIEPNADREDVLRKINIFRTNYRRECSRINMSLQEGRHYQSTLWYFDLLCFLQTADSRRERRRKLDYDGEKSIMRKRRSNNMMQKSADQFLIAAKKEHLIEYQPHTAHDFDYDIDEEADFDYVPDELAHTLVDDKSDTTSEIQQSIRHNYQVDEEEDDGRGQNHHEYNHQHEFENYTLQRGNSNQKVEFTADNVAHLPNEIVATDTNSEINGQSQEQQLFHEYENQENNETMHTAQWYIKTPCSENITGQKQQKQGLYATTIATATTMNIHENSSLSNKFVRDVKTMTATNPNVCCSKLSESSEILAKSWAIQYDELAQDQKILARKAINDILFEGCMGHLVIGSNNGRVTVNNGNDYKNLKTTKKFVSEEVESGEIYEQAQVASSTTSSPNVIGGGNSLAVTITTGEPTTTKIHSTNEWLKL